jgi:SecD/SecF fusion protein
MNPGTELRLLREVTSDGDGPSVEARDRARAALLARVERDTRGAERDSPRRPRVALRPGSLAVVVSVLVAVAVVAVFLHAGGKRSAGSRPASGVELVYLAEPTAQSAVTPTALKRAVAVMRNRVEYLGASGASIQTSGPNKITVQLPNVKNIALVEQQVGTTARLEFYDWEANALTPNGRTVASQLQAQDATATTISQGSGSVTPGSAGAGSLPLYQAVKLASRQPASASKNNAREGQQYYVFGAPGSAACARAAADHHTTSPAGVHCLLSDPVDEVPGTSQKQIQSDIASGMPAGVSVSQGQTLIVHQGTVVLLAAPATPGQQLNFNSPNAQFFVLKDNVSLFGNDITNPEPSTDRAGSPDVKFGLTLIGANSFQRRTAEIARRGQLVSGFRHTLQQHYAIALDNHLLTVPPIDYKSYPDGVSGGARVTLTGGFTVTSARDLATEMRLGVLSIRLKLISEAPMSSTRTASG